MAIDVVMPQMGESIAEGTVVRWIKKPGEKVERDEPLLEISTDKVDAEIPSPASGTLSEVLVNEGQTVAVNSVVARIAGEGQSVGTAAPKPAPPATPHPVPLPASGERVQGEGQKVTSLDERRRTKSSPLVRKIAAENNVDIAQIQGSGVSGRVTKNDILAVIQQPGAPASAGSPAKAGPPSPEFKSGESIRLDPL